MAANRVKLGLLVWVIGLAACGGGSSSGGSAGEAGFPPGPPPTTPAGPTRLISPDTGAREGPAEVGTALSHAVSLLGQARFAVEVVHRVLTLGTSGRLAADCVDNGTIMLDVDDKDGDGRVSAGDAIDVRFDDCGVPRLDRRLQGSFRLDLLDVGTDPTKSLRVRYTIADELRLLRFQSGFSLVGVPTVTERGVVEFEWSESAGEHRLSITEAPGNDWFVHPGEGTAGAPVALRQIALEQVFVFSRSTVRTTLGWISARGGSTLRFRTLEPMSGHLDVPIRQMVLQVDGAGGWSFRARRENNPLIGSPVVPVDVLNPAGEVMSSGTLTPDWDRLQALSLSPYRNKLLWSNSDEGGSGVESYVPWKNGRDEVFDAGRCRKDGSTGSVLGGCDALFMGPAVPGPGLAAAGFVTRVQVRGDIGAAYPDLQFRWIRAESFSGSPARDAWPIPTTAERSGAAFLVTSLAPLKRGSQHVLQVSADGMTWGRPLDFFDSSGRAVATRISVAADAYAYGVIKASARQSHHALLGRHTASQLRAVATTLDGSEVATSHEWRQLSGPPLILSDPRARDPFVSPGWSGTRPVEAAVMELRVVDAMGRTDYDRVTLQVGDVVAEGAAHFVEIGRAGRIHDRQLQAGPGFVQLDPTPGMVAPRLVLSDDTTTPFGFSIRPAGGAPLTIGLYPDAVRDLSLTGAHFLVAGELFCEDASASTGSFEVLDVAYDDSGRIIRLAVDYQQQCTDFGEPVHVRGSYRLASGIPLSP